MTLSYDTYYIPIRLTLQLKDPKFVKFLQTFIENNL